MPGPPLVFRSKIDAWFLVLTIIFVAMMVRGAVIMIVSRHQPIVASIVVGAVALWLWLLVDTKYVIDDAELRVRSGPIRCRIPLRSIRAIRASRSLLSSPALSIDRLEIVHAGGSVLISPRDRRGFLKAVSDRVPALTIEGV